MIAESSLRAEVRFERNSARPAASPRRSGWMQMQRISNSIPRSTGATGEGWSRLGLPDGLHVAARDVSRPCIGAVERPTHANTDADLAQYEVPGHRWAICPSPASVSRCSATRAYGYSTFDGTMGLSLLRGTNAPESHGRSRRASFPLRACIRMKATGGRPARSALQPGSNDQFSGQKEQRPQFCVDRLCRSNPQTWSSTRSSLRKTEGDGCPGFMRARDNPARRNCRSAFRSGRFIAAMRWKTGSSRLRQRRWRCGPMASSRSGSIANDVRQERRHNKLAFERPD